jgi:hypothetical protein
MILQPFLLYYIPTSEEKSSEEELEVDGSRRHTGISRFADSKIQYILNKALQ